MLKKMKEALSKIQDKIPKSINTEQFKGEEKSEISTKEKTKSEKRPGVQTAGEVVKGKEITAPPHATKKTKIPKDKEENPDKIQKKKKVKKPKSEGKSNDPKTTTEAPKKKKRKGVITDGDLVKNITAPPPPIKESKSINTTKINDFLLAFINKYRENKGAKPLILDESLTGMSEDHSKHMAAQKKQSHDNIIERIEQEYGTSAEKNAVGENVAFKGTIPEMSSKEIAKGIFIQWRNSKKGHKENMLSDTFSVAGISVEAGYNEGLKSNGVFSTLFLSQNTPNKEQGILQENSSIQANQLDNDKLKQSNLSKPPSDTPKHSFVANLTNGPENSLTNSR